MILSCQNLSKSFGENCVLKNITFHINDNEKVALIGNNGAGKTTLFHILIKEMSPDSGDVTFKKDATIGYLAQHQDYSSDKTVYEELLEVKRPLILMENELRDMEHDMKNCSDVQLESLLKKYHEKMHTFDLQGGYTYKSDIAGVLKGLQFEIEDYDKKVTTLSGGERTRLLLGRVLLEKPDLILLDEPTNYLDIDAVSWLETYLLNVKSAVFVVSHDRYFINKIVSKVVEIDQGKSFMYEGNYDDFISKKEVFKKALITSYENQQREIKHQEEVISKLRSFNREKSIKRADSRQKLLNKMELIEKPTEEKADMNLSLSPNTISGNDVLLVDSLKKSYGSRILFENVSFKISRGEHIAFIGKNGTGKTNILKIINQLITADEGTVTLGTNVTIGYFDQQSQVLDLNKTVFDEISDTYPSLTQTQIRNVLAAFLFREDFVFNKISSLSGGERGRVVLAKLMLSGANFLILDEPTNHLDMISKEILENALNNYTGTVLYVSHDRYFINKTASRVLALENCKVKDYIGNYDDYLEKYQQLQDLNHTENLTVVSKEIDTEPESKNDWEKQKELLSAKRKLQNAIARVESDIEEAELQLEDLNRKMADPLNATNSVKLQELCTLHREISIKLDDLYKKWDELSSQQ